MPMKYSVLRGGSYSHYDFVMRSDYRYLNWPTINQNNNVGFRVVENPKKEKRFTKLKGGSQYTFDEQLMQSSCKISGNQFGDTSFRSYRVVTIEKRRTKCIR